MTGNRPIAVGKSSLYSRVIGQGQSIIVLHGGPDRRRRKRVFTQRKRSQRRRAERTGFVEQVGLVGRRPPAPPADQLDFSIQLVPSVYFVISVVNILFSVRVADGTVGGWSERDPYADSYSGGVNAVVAAIPKVRAWRRASSSSLPRSTSPRTTSLFRYSKSRVRRVLA